MKSADDELVDDVMEEAERTEHATPIESGPAPEEPTPEPLPTTPIVDESYRKRPLVHVPPRDLNERGWDKKCPAYAPAGTRCKMCGKEHK